MKNTAFPILWLLGWTKSSANIPQTWCQSDPLKRQRIWMQRSERHFIPEKQSNPSGLCYYIQQANRILLWESVTAACDTWPQPVVIFLPSWRVTLNLMPILHKPLLPLLASCLALFGSLMSLWSGFQVPNFSIIPVCWLYSCPSLSANHTLLPSLLPFILFTNPCLSLHSWALLEKNPHLFNWNDHTYLTLHFLISCMWRFTSWWATSWT